MSIWFWIIDTDYYTTDYQSNENSDLFDRNQGIPIYDAWKPVVLSIEKEGCQYNQIGDFSKVSGTGPLISQKVVDVTGDMLNANGLLLPVDIAGIEQNYYYYYCTTLIDCLDKNKTDYNTLSSNQNIFINVHFPVFHTDKIHSDLFCLPQLPFTHTIFVSDKFKEAVEKHQLTGVLFLEKSSTLREYPRR